tara:strand:+ start:2911 stop:3960 length:1050 start_codon:yes stop_codon:yes gene_type:complete
VAARAKSFEVDPAIRLEMARLQKCGLCLVPLGGGADGKSPLVIPGVGERLSLRQVLGPMYGRGSMTYGVRLSGMVVLDADDPTFLQQIENRFGPASVVIATPRGFHAYYRGGPVLDLSLRREGWPVDVKQGGNSYVVGPWSTRPDGGRYTAQRGVLGATELRSINTPATGAVKASDMREGERHAFLLREALGMVRYVDGEAELLANLLYVRDQLPDVAAKVQDSEVAGIVAWTWQKRLSGKLFGGRDSAFTVHRMALDRLKGNSDALALWVVLQDQHGHMAARSFGLNHPAMMAAGHTDLTRRRFRAAVAYLIAQGLLEVAANHSQGRRVRQYRLRHAFEAVAGKVETL